jgi:uncharacterized protein YfdQ (DUF2303 family)
MTAGEEDSLFDTMGKSCVVGLVFLSLARMPGCIENQAHRRMPERVEIDSTYHANKTRAYNKLLNDEKMFRMNQKEYENFIDSLKTQHNYQVDSIKELYKNK